MNASFKKAAQLQGAVIALGALVLGPTIPILAVLLCRHASDLFA